MPSARHALALVLSTAGCGFSPAPVPSHPFFEGGKGLQVIAHRGGAGLRPENTLAAFEHAARLGADILEMDLRASADGAIVVLHDAAVDRTTEGSGPVEDLTLEQIRALDAAYRWTDDGGRSFPFRGQGLRIPTLQEVFERLPRKRMLLELKTTGAAFARDVCALIRKESRARESLVACFDDASIRAFREACPEVATASSSREARIYGWLGGVLTPPAQALVIPLRWRDRELATAALIAQARERNLRVHVFTVNDEQDLHALIGRGADGVITDRPDRLLALLGRG